MAWPPVARSVRMVLLVALLSLSLKALLIPAYFSTDFDVHRHWLALTYSTPTIEWYDDHTAEKWPLDYPPLFAFFEMAPELLQPLDVLPSGALPPHAVAFHRLTVILSGDVALLTCSLAAHAPSARRRDESGGTPLESGLLLLLLHPTLLLVDNVHFQYNGVVLGVTLLAVGLVASRRAPLAAGCALAAAVHLKHTAVLPALPAIATFLLASAGPDRNVHVGVTVLSAAATTALIWLPLRAARPASVLRRLFPVQRGLLHSYWAPNAYALMAGLDRAVARWRRVPSSAAAMGVVGVAQPMAVLPNVTAPFTALLCAAAALPALACAARAARSVDPRARLVGLSKAACHCALSAFVFGWHVHEKAILYALLPMVWVVVATPPVAQSAEDERAWRRLFRVLTVTGTFAQFALLHAPGETALKYLVLGEYLGLLAVLLPTPLPGALEALYYGALAAVEIYARFLHSWCFGARLPFLPLLLTSCAGAVGVCASWLYSGLLLVRPAADAHAKQL